MAASGTAAATSGAAAGASIVTKIVAGIIAAAIAIGGGAVLYQALKPDDEPMEVVSAIDENGDISGEASPSPDAEDNTVETPDLEALNIERIAVYLSVVDELGSGGYDANRYLLYDYDGDGLSELLTSTFDSDGMSSDVFTINEDGEAVSIYSVISSGIRVSDRFFILLAYESEEYFAYAHSDVSGGTGVIYGNYYLLGEKDGKLEEIHTISWMSFINEDAQKAYEQSLFVPHYYHIDDEEMDSDKFMEMKETAVFLIDDSLTHDEFIAAYKNP